MHKYFIRTPWLVRKVFPHYIWKLPAEGNKVYLSFDDGPHPEITPWVLELLKAYHAKATFFCIGNNVEKYPEVYQRILDEGHAVGNHTYRHLNGWKTEDPIYIDDIKKAGRFIRSDLFRPPYGRLKTSQAKQVAAAMEINQAKIIMWDVLSADFDPDFSPEQCFDHVARYTAAGSIIVFHDSEKAFKNLEFALPASLQYLSETGFLMEKVQ